MVCPKLDSRDPAVPLCRLKRGANYIPDDEELFQFCYTESHCSCPVYLQDRDVWMSVCRQEVERVIG